jgi:dUTP pyrophosphatase
MDRVFKSYGAYILLRIAVYDELIDHYTAYVEEFNNRLLNSIENPFEFVNDGFDLVTPASQHCEQGKTTKVNFGVKIEATYISETHQYPCGMKLYARSSIFKTPLRLANAVGVIDPGYRGDIQGVFDSQSEFILQRDSRIVQLCASSEVPIYAQLIPIEELSESSRGENGFGSSG